jgi:hypothetical protein
MERSSSARAATIYPCSDGLMKIGVGDLPSSQHLSGKLGSLAAHLFCILVVLFDCGFVRVHFVTYFCYFSIPCKPSCTYLFCCNRRCMDM